VLRQVAHDLRTPLGSLSLWLRLARADDAEAEPSRRALVMAEDGALALGRFARDLVDAAQLVEGSLRLERAPVELNALLGRVVEAVRLRAAAKEVSLAATPCPEAVQVLADGERLGRALEVLVERALAQAPKGGNASVVLSVSNARARIAIAPASVGREGLPAIEHWHSPAGAGRARPTLALAVAGQLLAAQGATVEPDPRGLTVVLPLAGTKGAKP
jgi:signal transduction histidine kinase